MLVGLMIIIHGFYYHFNKSVMFPTFTFYNYDKEENLLHNLSESAANIAQFQTLFQFTNHKNLDQKSSLRPADTVRRITANIKLSNCGSTTARIETSSR